VDKDVIDRGERLASTYSSRTGVAEPILYHLRPFILRRVKTSTDLFDGSIVELTPVEIVTHSLKLSRHEQIAYDEWANKAARSKNPRAQNFQILGRSCTSIDHEEYRNQQPILHFDRQNPDRHPKDLD
jgi:hypothetical protein